MSTQKRFLAPISEAFIKLRSQSPRGHRRMPDPTRGWRRASRLPYSASALPRRQTPRTARNAAVAVLAEERAGGFARADHAAGVVLPGDAADVPLAADRPGKAASRDDAVVFTDDAADRLRVRR